MTRASVLAALFVCLSWPADASRTPLVDASAYWTGTAVTDDRFGYYGPVSRRHIAADGAGPWACLRQDPRARQRCGGKAKRYKNHVGRHHRRRAARIVRGKIADRVPFPQPRPLARVAATHPWAWLADETEQAATAVAATAVEAATVAGRTLLAYARALYRPAHRNVRLTCGDGQPLPPRLMAVVNRAAAHFGAQAYVNSGYRSPAHNRRVGGARGSQHMRCRAVDFYVKGVDGGRLYAWARRQPEPTGLGRYRGNFIHIDIRPGRRVTWDWRGGRSRRLRLASR